jgi:serine phosphatase RsbU (regulator of sigma subunit)
VAVHQVTREQELRVNESGARVVCTLAALIRPEWLDDDDELDRLRLQEVLERVLRATQDLGVLNAMVRPPDENLFLATGLRGEKGFSESTDNRKAIKSDIAKRVGVDILEFDYEGDPIRSFRRSIMGPRKANDESEDSNSTHEDSGSEDDIADAEEQDEQDQEVLGFVEVFLSGKLIEDSRGEVQDRMITLSFFACLAAALGSLFLGKLLARPIHTLVKDLHQVSLGNLNHKSAVDTIDEIGDLARTFNQMIDNLRQAQNILIAQKATEHELNLATRIQQKLLPTSNPRLPGFEIAAYYNSAHEIGGDYYDFVPIDDEHLGLVVADVSGKGIPGSLVMTMTRSLLRLAARGVTSPRVTVRRVNRALSPDMNPGMFVTLLYLVLHHPSRTARFVRAGHTPALYFSAKTSRLVPLQPGGIALGLDITLALFDEDLEVQQINFQEGDFLVSFTDGVVEAKNEASDDYTMERLARVLRSNATQSPQTLIDRVLADVATFCGDAEQADDITLVVIKFTGPS